MQILMAFQCIFTYSVTKSSLDSLMLLKVLSTVAVVTGNTIRIAANLARLGKEVFVDI